MKQKPSISLSIIIIIAAFMLSTIIAGIVTSIAFSWLDEDIRSFLMYGLCALLTIGIVVSIKGTLGITVPTLKPEIRKLSPTTIVTGFIMIMAAGIVLDPVIELIPDVMMDRLYNMMDGGLWPMLSAVVLAPLFEEYLFRGVIQKNLTDKVNPITGIIVASVIFGAVHIIPQQAVGAMAIGVIIGSVYYITGSLNTVIALHFLNNGYASLMYMIFKDTNKLEKIISSDETTHIIIYAASVIILILGTAYVLKTINKRKLPKSQSV